MRLFRTGTGLIWALCAHLFLLPTPSQARQSTPFTLETVVVEFSHGASAEVTLDCVTMGEPGEERRNVLLIHGANHNTYSFDPLVELLTHPENYAQEAFNIHRLCALDLPGHGSSAASSLQEIEFAALGLEHYTSVLNQTLRAYYNQDSDPALAFDTLIGHSMGGMLIQTLAERQHKDHDRGLAEAYGITRTLLLSPTLPHQVYWKYGDSSLWSPDLQSLVSAVRMLAYTPDLGLHAALPPRQFIELFLTSPEITDQALDGVPLPYTADDVKALADVETVRAWGQLYGLDLVGDGETCTRPHVRPGALQDQRLITVSFTYDSYMRACELQSLNLYLSAPAEPQRLASFEQASPWRDDTGPHTSCECSDPDGETPLLPKTPPASADSGVCPEQPTFIEGHYHVGGALSTHDGFFLDPQSPELLAAIRSLLSDGARGGVLPPDDAE